MERNRDYEEEEGIQEPAAEGEAPRGWRPSEETIKEIQGPKETPTPPQDVTVVGDANDAKALSDAFAKLESTDAGQPIAQAMREKGTSLTFAPLEAGTVAQFSPATNEITIGDKQKDSSPAVLASRLAHEGIHAGWDHDYRLNSFEEFADDYVNEEYQAFEAQAEVWQATKGDERDSQCDWVSDSLIAKGEAEAKAIVRAMYFEDINREWRRLTSGAIR